MGIHIVVINRAFEKHPEWDWIRYVNDRDFYSLFWRQDLQWIMDTEPGDVIGVRPTNIQRLRDLIREQDYENEGRYIGLCDILEEDEQWFVRWIA